MTTPLTTNELAKLRAKVELALRATQEFPGDAHCAEAAGLAEVVGRLLDECEDWRAGARRARDERCDAGDERHCTCVPVLRAALAVAETKAAQHEADWRQAKYEFGSAMAMLRERGDMTARGATARALAEAARAAGCIPELAAELAGGGQSVAPVGAVPADPEDLDEPPPEPGDDHDQVGF